MAKEIARTTRGTVEPYAGGPEGDELLPYSPITPQSFDVPDFVALRPPDTGKFQAKWAAIMMPFRWLALAFLWITFYWWRTAILIALVLMIVVLFRMS
jgi:hypothetical protein